MNKKIKNIFVGTICAMFIAPAVGADASVAARTDCSALSTRIGELAAIENPDDATASELAQLQAQYRSNCSRSAAGRPAAGRVSTMSVVASTPDVTPIATPTVTVITAYSALTDYLTARRSLCDDLSADIYPKEMGLAIINSQRACELDAVDSTLVSLSEYFTEDEGIQMKALINQKYDQRVKEYEQKNQLWDTQVKISMVLIGKKL